MSSEQSMAKAREVYAAIHGFDSWDDFLGGHKPWGGVLREAGVIAQALNAARDAALEEAASRCDELSDYIGDLAWTKCRVANAARQIRALKTKGGSDE